MNLYKGLIGTSEIVLYAEVVLNSEVIFSWRQDKCPLYGDCFYFRGPISDVPLVEEHMMGHVTWSLFLQCVRISLMNF